MLSLPHTFKRPSLDHSRRRFYVGRVEDRRPAVFIVGHDVRRLEGRFDWGTDEPASRRLAAGLLRDACGRRPAPNRVSDFLVEVVACLPADGFVLAADYVKSWA
jgi:hypothetical protein